MVKQIQTHVKGGRFVVGESSPLFASVREDHALIRRTANTTNRRDTRTCWFVVGE